MFPAAETHCCASLRIEKKQCLKTNRYNYNNSDKLNFCFILTLICISFIYILDKLWFSIRKLGVFLNLPLKRECVILLS